MGKAEEMGFIQQAESELRQRITKTTSICDQFRKSYSGYSSVAWQIFLLVLLVTAAAGLIWAATNIATILNILSTQDDNRDSLLVKAALAGIFLYITLNMIKYVTRILRISNIDNLIRSVRNIEKKLQSSLDKISKKADELDKIIFGKTNRVLKADYNADAEIAKYSDIERAYSNPDNNSLNVAMTITHWVSGILFIGVFLFITTPFIIEKMGGGRIEIEETQTSVVVYGTVTASELNVRDGPGRNYNEQGKLHKGDKVVIAEKYDSHAWIKIEYGENKVGYVDGDYLSIIEEEYHEVVPRAITDFYLDNMITLVYMASIIALFMIFQEFFAKNSILYIHEKIRKVIGVLLTIASICGAITIFGMELYYFLLNSTFNISSFIYCFIPLITLSIFLSIILKICELVSFNAGYALLGMIFAGVVGLTIGSIIMIICDIIGYITLSAYILFFIIIAIGVIFGLFWSGIEASRKMFSLHRAFFGAICGIFYGIYFSLRFSFSAFSAFGCLWGLIPFVLAILISPIFVLIYPFKGYVIYGRGEGWDDFDDLFGI